MINIWRLKMLELYKLGIKESEIRNILAINPSIQNLSESEILKLIMLLKQINANDRIIRNIIISNPFYLNRTDTDIIKLIKTLTHIGLSNLDILFDTNPYLLNKDDFEIEEFINNKIQSYSKEEIMDMIDNNPYIFDEE